MAVMNKLVAGAEDSPAISKKRGWGVGGGHSIINSIIPQSVSDGSARQRRQMKVNQSGLNFCRRLGCELINFRKKR